MTPVACKQVPRELLRLGVSLDALCCGQEQMPIDRPCLVQKALAALWHLVQRGEPLLPHAHVIMALFINCCQAEYMPVLENDSTEAFAMKYGGFWLVQAQKLSLSARNYWRTMGIPLQPCFQVLCISLLCCRESSEIIKMRAPSCLYQ